MYLMKLQLDDYLNCEREQFFGFYFLNFIFFFFI